MFKEVTQAVGVSEGVRIRARAQVKADNLRVEFQQREDSVYLSLVFVDPAGYPLGRPIRSIARLGTHNWEPLELDAVAPPGAAGVRVGLLSGVSGIAYFDAVMIEIL